MANRILIPAANPALRRLPYPRLLPSEQFDVPLWKSLVRQIHDHMHSQRRPPLRVTSRPVPVRAIWGTHSYRGRGLVGSTLVHLVILSGLVAASVSGTEVTKPVRNKVVTPLIAPDISEYMPVSSKKDDPISGGGGGGDRDKLPPPRGRLPKRSMEQLAPPVVVIRNDHPKLPVTPSVVVPPQLQLADNQLPNLGDPVAALPAAPPSNGTGSGGGIGSGRGGGVGTGTGPGVGPGSGGGIGGGVFHVGEGVSAPRAIFAPDPDYTEEARKAKLEGTCVLWMIVGPDGHPRTIKVSRPLGLGLDQKAVEAVRNWKFEPARKNGQPVAVQISVEIRFKLY